MTRILAAVALAALAVVLLRPRRQHIVLVSGVTGDDIDWLAEFHPVPVAMN